MIEGWRDRPADAPPGHAVRLRQPVDRHRPLRHAVEGGDGHVPEAVVDDVLVDLVGDGDGIPPAAERGDRLELGAAEHLAGRIVWRVEDDRLRPVVEGGRQLVWVECPIRLVQRHVARRRAGQNRVGAVVLVERLEDHHFVARIDDGHHRGHHGLGRAAAHGDLLVGADRHAVAARELAGNCLAQRSGAPRHRVLVDVGLDGGARRVLDRLGGRKVGESLREIHATVLVTQSRHLADDRFGELSRFFRAGELGHRNRVIE